MLIERLTFIALAACAGTALGWSSPQNISGQVSGSRAFGPRAARDPPGNTHVVWAGGLDPSTNWRAYYQVYDGTTWSSPLALSGPNANRPDIAMDANGRIHVVYEEVAERNIWYRSKPVGGGWSSPVNLRTGGRSISPHIAVNANGDRILVAWHEDGQVGGEWDIFVNIYDGVGWSGTTNVSLNSDLSSEPRVCIDSQGNMHVAWTDAQKTIRHRVRNSSGEWGAIKTIYGTSNRCGLGSICASPDGFVHAAYSVDDGSSDWRVWYKYYDGNWSGGTPIYTHTAADDDVGPTVYADAYSRLYMVFYNNAPNNNKIHFASAASLSSAWSTVTTLVSGWYGAAGPVIAIDNTLTARAFWQGQPVSGNPWNIYTASQSVGTPPPQGILAGEVRDQFNNLLPGATVSTGNAAGITNANGQFAFPVPAGTYTVTCTRPYFASRQISGVVVVLDQTTTCNFQISSIPSGPVLNLTVVAGNQQNLLNWTNPSDGQFAGAMIRVRTDGSFPADSTDGTLVANVAGNPGVAGGYLHLGLFNGMTYRYGVFAYDSYTPHSYAPAATVTGTPAGPCDFDRDGDVDQSDWGVFQTCLTGPFTPQVDSSCGGTTLDNDTDVDDGDTMLFVGCMSGAGRPANPHCLP